MVLERLALAVAITLGVHSGDANARPAVEIALDASAGREERAVALVTLHLDAHRNARVLAIPANTPVSDVTHQATHRWGLPTLEALSRHESVRSAAAELRMHHSTVQSRLIELTEVLGWVVRTPRGQTRLDLALALHRQTFN